MSIELWRSRDKKALKRENNTDDIYHGYGFKKNQIPASL